MMTFPIYGKIKNVLFAPGATDRSERTQKRAVAVDARCGRRQGLYPGPSLGTPKIFEEILQPKQTRYEP